MKDTNSIIKIAMEKLLEVQKKSEGDTKKLEQLLADRGSIEANMALGTGTDVDTNKIKNLSVEILKLKVEIEAGAPLISALKGKILSFKTQAEREQKERDVKQQLVLEGKMAGLSKGLLPLLEGAVKKNKELASLYGDWLGLSEKTGVANFNKKVLQPSNGILDLLYQTLLDEYNGVSNGRVRKFYSQANFRATGVVF